MKKALKQTITDSDFKDTLRKSLQEALLGQDFYMSDVLLDTGEVVIEYYDIGKTYAIPYTFDMATMVVTLAMDKKREVVRKTEYEGVEAKKSRSITPGIAKTIGGDKPKGKCPGCDMAIPKYKGRYPKKCPDCGESWSFLSEKKAASAEPKPGELITCATAANIQDAGDKEGKLFGATVIKQGYSRSGKWFWEKEAINDLMSILQTGFVDVNMNHQGPAEQKEFGVRNVENGVGWLNGSSKDNGFVRSELSVVDPTWRQRLKNAAEMGRPDYYHLSVSLYGDTEDKEENGEIVRHVKRIHLLESVDLVSEGEAYGTVDRLVASARKAEPQKEIDMVLKDIKSIEALKQADAAFAALVMGMDAASALKLLQHYEASTELCTEIEAALAPSEEEPAATEEEPAAAEETPAEEEPVEEEPAAAEQAQQSARLRILSAEPIANSPGLERIEQRTTDVVSRLKVAEGQLHAAECKTALTESLVGASKPLAEQIQHKYGKAKTFDLGRFREDIGDWRGLATRVQASSPGFVNTSVGTGDDHIDKCKKALEGYMLGGFPVDGVQPFNHINQAYEETTGRRPNAHEMLRESRGWMPKFMTPQHPMYETQMKFSAYIRQTINTTDWSNVFGDVRYNMLVRGYEDPNYQNWKKLVSQYGNHNDFEQRQLTRTGGYANLSSVTAGDAYDELTTPSDEKINSTLVKYGGLESITEEAYRADKIAAIGRNRMEMGRAAVRTLEQTMFNWMKDNGTAYDAILLGDASDHVNLTTTAFSTAAWKVCKKSMRDQTEYNVTGGYLGDRNLPKFFIGANELEETAYQNFSVLAHFEPGTTDTLNALAQHTNPGVEVITRDDWTSATMWWATADPQRMNVFYVAFLDGIQQPQMYTSDDPSQGHMLYSDKIVDKIRFAFDTEPMDFRSFFYGQA